MASSLDAVSGVLRDVRAGRGVCVDEGLRGTSGGCALIEAVYAAAEGGSPSLYWLTQHFNETGRWLYDRVGTLSPFLR